MRWALVAMLAAGCYAPQPHAGAPCPDGACPTGLVCSPATMTCETTAVDARGPDAAPIMTDAAKSIDARPIDAPPPPNVPALRQQKVNTSDSASALSATFTMAPTSGDLLVMMGENTSGDLTSVTGAAATWTHATSSTVYGNIEIWYAVANGSGSTITVNRSVQSGPMMVSITEWTGTSGTLIDATSTSGTAALADPGTVTTTGPALLVLGITDEVGNTFGAPSPGTWLDLTGTANAGYMQDEWYRVAPAAGTFGAQVSDTAHFWEAGIAAFAYTP